MPIEGNGKARSVRTSNHPPQRPARRWALALGLALVCFPAPALANRVEPLVVDEAVGLSAARPWASPTGEQLITYLRQGQASPPLVGISARTDGGPFATFSELSGSPTTTPPVLGFGSDGAALIAWGSETGAEQTVRPPGGVPEVAGPAGSCRGPVTLAVSRGGRTLSGCRVDTGLGTEWSGWAGLGQMPSRIDPGTGVTRATGDPGIVPVAAWSTDGTGVIAFGYRDEGPPVETRIEARIVNPDSQFTDVEEVVSVPEPATITPTGAAVLPNGMVAITAETDEGAALFTRPAGPGGSFSRTDLPEETASMPSADQWGRLHFLTSITNDTGDTTWSVRIRELDGSLREAIPVPTTGANPAPAEQGFQVYPNGAEAIITRSDRGFFVAFRRPGAGAFQVPRRLVSTAGTSSTGGSVARTPWGDLLLVWEREATPGLWQLMLGGWDSGAAPVIRRISMPKRVRRGARATFSVTASDQMGISRVVWKFPGNRRSEGSRVRARLTRPGANPIKVIVFDRAGNRSVRIRQVKVVSPKQPRAQGRAGTSGSPRP